MTSAHNLPPARPVFGPFGRHAAAILVMAAPLAALAQGALQAWTGAAHAPPIELKTVDGQPLALPSLRGKVVVVNFWATWCEPCIEEMPSMQRLRQQLAGESFEILAVNFQEGEPRIHNFLKKVPVTIPIVRDTDGGGDESLERAHLSEQLRRGS